MRSTGYVRKVNAIGKIAIPYNIRKEFDIRENSLVELYLQDNKIYIKKYVPMDFFNGNTKNLIEYKGINVSRETILELIKIANLNIEE